MRNNTSAPLAAGDTRFYLELHHKRAAAEDLDALPPDELNREENLVTLCYADHLKGPPSSKSYVGASAARASFTGYAGSPHAERTERVDGPRAHEEHRA